MSTTNTRAWFTRGPDFVDVPAHLLVEHDTVGSAFKGKAAAQRNAERETAWCQSGHLPTTTVRVIEVDGVFITVWTTLP